MIDINRGAEVPTTSILAARSVSDNCDLLLMTFGALPVTFLLLGSCAFLWPVEGRHLSAHGQLYGPRGNKFSNVTAQAADNDLFDAKDGMIHPGIVH